MTLTLPDGVKITGKVDEAGAGILTPEAIDFVTKLSRKFQPVRKRLLAARVERQKRLDAGERPDFLGSTREIREGDWKVAPAPADLQDRRVEITGPVDRKMIVNALNSGASVYMADFEDATSPTWENILSGQVNVRAAVNREIDFTSPEGKTYRINDKAATMVVRTRGWHLPEGHFLVDAEPISGSLFDFGFFFFHNAKAQIARGTGPYFYIPKLENHLEARLWNDVFNFAQDYVGIPRGTIKCTVLIESILATFETEEILYELRDHCTGLNCGRWDYMFSFIKKLRNQPGAVMPERSQLLMTTPFLRAYCYQVIKTCHRRGAHAMGGMAAQIPIRHDPRANELALEKVRADKLREVTDGFDGTWVAHPGLVETALIEFDKHMPQPNQLDRLREDVTVTAADLLRVPDGSITEAGLRKNISVGIQYIEAWLGGSGAVPLYYVMEDPATAEICRSQVWQWLAYEAHLDDGRLIDNALYDQFLREELKKIEAEIGKDRYANGRFELATKLFTQMTRDRDYADFLTLLAYPYLD